VSTITVTPSTNLAKTISSAPSGSTIQLEAGTYNLSSSITLPSNITIEGGSGVAVNYTGSTDSTGLFLASGVQNVTIEDIAFTGTGLKNLTNGVVEVSNASNIHIQSDTFNNVSNTSDLMDWNGNNIYFQGNTSGPNEQEPVSAHLTQAANLSGLYITDNTFLGYQRFGVELQNNEGSSQTWSNIHVDRNVFDTPSSAEYGALSFVTGGGTGNTIYGNTFNSSGGHVAIELGSANTTVENNKITGSSWPISISAASDSAILGNIISGAGNPAYSKDGGFSTSAVPWIGTNTISGSSITGADGMLGSIPNVSEPKLTAPSTPYVA